MENKLSNIIIGAAIEVHRTLGGPGLLESIYMDILVSNKVIIEIKATEGNHPVFKSQLLTYLRLTGIRLGLLINFGNSYVKNGITRILNDCSSLCL